MIKTYTNINPNEPMDVKGQPKVGMKVRELEGGRIATITGVYETDDEVWMVSGNDIGVLMLSHFWELFEEVKS